jgi:CRISPR/Cas system-associated exonuclease Cas4 (RecB family)
MSFVVGKMIEAMSQKLDYELSDRFTIHPSSLKSCPRSQVIRAAGIRPYTTPSNELMFCVANTAHNMIEMLMGDSLEGVHCTSECRMTMPEYLMSGTADMVVSGPLIKEVETNIRGRAIERGIIDIKTKAFVNKKDTVTDAHIAQVQVYMHMADAQFATLLYVSRVNGQYEMYDVDYDEAYVNAILNGVDELFDTLDNGDIPDPDRDCNRCWYMKYCESMFLDKMREVILESYNASKTEEFISRRG